MKEKRKFRIKVIMGLIDNWNKNSDYFPISFRSFLRQFVEF